MTAPSRQLVSSRVRGPAGTAAILAGDVVVLGAFLSVGLLSHSIEPWRFPAYTLTALLPFLLAWLVVAPLAGLYGEHCRRRYRHAAVWTTAGWIAASLLGGAIRATSTFPGGAPIDFLLVNAAVGIAFFLPWRLFAVAATRRLTPYS